MILKFTGRVEKILTGSISGLHPQLRAGKEIIRWVTVAVLKKNAAAGEIEYILRNISKIAPV